MKILYCIPTLGLGGAERQLSYLAEELARAGHEVHVACGRSGALYERLRSGGVAVHELGGRRNHDPRLLLDLVRLIRRVRPDVVQTFLTQMDVAGGAAALLTRTPWVIRESSAAPAYPAGWKSSLRLALGRRAEMVVSNSGRGDAYWRAAGAHRRAVVPNALPLAEIDALRGGPRDRTILFAGRMDDGKNAATLLEALARIAGDVDVAALFCGDGRRRPALERRAAELGLADRVAFPGYVADLWSRMKRAGVFASLSRFEGSPNAVMEAMVCGCPLVLSDIAAHRELAGDGGAWFVPPDDAAAAAAAIREALASPPAADTRARAAQWSVGSMARRYEEIYLALRSQA